MRAAAPLRRAAVAAALLALAACARDGLDARAGLVAGDRFGAATANNHAVNVSRGGHVAAIGARFAAEVPTQVTFDFDSAALTPAARAVLDRQADWMRQFPELGFRVFGHADAPGSGAYNERLGRRRAEAAVAYLGARGVSLARLEALVSFGESRPAIPGAGRERRNRRVVTAVSGFDARHPTVLNGKYAEVVFREYVASAVPEPGANQATTSEIAAPGG